MDRALSTMRLPRLLIAAVAICCAAAGASADVAPRFSPACGLSPEVEHGLVAIAFLPARTMTLLCAFADSIKLRGDALISRRDALWLQAGTGEVSGYIQGPKLEVPKWAGPYPSIFGAPSEQTDQALIGPHHFSLHVGR